MTIKEETVDLQTPAGPMRTYIFRPAADGKYPGLTLGSPMVDYVGLARAQGVEGEAVTKAKDLEIALKRGLERATKENRPYLLDVSVAREGVGADATWDQDWTL